MSAAVPAANLISVVLFTAVHTPKNVVEPSSFNLYISLFFTSASVAAVPPTVNTAFPSVADNVLSLLTIPVLVKQLKKP